MSRDARVVLEVVDRRELGMLVSEFRRAGKRFDVERGDGTIECYVDASGDPVEVARDALRFLVEQGLGDSIAPAPRIERWSERAFRYVDPTEPPRAPTEPLTDVRWRIVVWPTDFFDWNRAEAELARRERPPLRKTRRTLEIPAADEADARDLASALRQISGVGPMKVEKLGPFQRWLARERLFGGYAGGGGGGGG